MRVLLICDFPEWILCRIAQHLRVLASPRLSVTTLVSRADGFLSQFSRLQRTSHVVHFLSPWEFVRCASTTYLPCVLTVWHVGDWADFEQHLWRVDTFCTGSRQWEQRLRQRLPPDTPVRRMQYGLDTDRFRRDPSAKARFLGEHSLPRDTLVFGFAGSEWSNRDGRKGLDRLWACFTRLGGEVETPFLLRIIGPGWQPDMVPDALRATIHFGSFLPESQLAEFYSTLDYYVCTSRDEGVPYPVIESMSCECVVLSTPVGLVPEILSHGGNGFLLREGHVSEDFVSAVLQTGSDHEFRTRCGERARDTVVRELNWATAGRIDRLEEIYEAAICAFRSRALSQRIGFFVARYFPRVRRYYATVRSVAG